jgi:hypothetical protein
MVTRLGPLNLTNLTTPTLNPVTNLVKTKQQVRTNITNLVTSQRVWKETHPA